MKKNRALAKQNSLLKEIQKEVDGQTKLDQNRKRSNLIIKPGCITCGACEFIAPQVFQVTDICHIRSNVAIKEHETSIECAMQACPVQVIDYQESQ